MKTRAADPLRSGPSDPRPRVRRHAAYRRNLAGMFLVVFTLLAYGWLQPHLNRQFSWQLPSISEFVQELLGEVRPEKSAPSEPGDVASRETPSPESESRATRAGAKRSGADRPGDEVSALLDELPPGWLEDLGARNYRSPQGLIYGPGSVEGHRLLHLARHLKDQPDRPGPHGVFDRPLADVLTWIDLVQSRAEERATGVRRRVEGRRTILEAEFSQRIGYVGGRAGAERGHPAARRLRLVLEGREVITAFPF